MPCLVKCYPGGVDRSMKVLVRTQAGWKLPGRNPKGFSPRDGERVFLWAIEQGHGGEGLAQRGHIRDFHVEGKSFRLQVLDVESPARAFRGADVTDYPRRSGVESSVKHKIDRLRHPSIVQITDEEAAYLDGFYR
jgi:hypothetical protein